MKTLDQRWASVKAGLIAAGKWPEDPVPRVARRDSTPFAIGDITKLSINDMMEAMRISTWAKEWPLHAAALQVAMQLGEMPINEIPAELRGPLTALLRAVNTTRGLRETKDAIQRLTAKTQGRRG